MNLKKKLMLDYAFSFFDVVWFHVSPSNIRSQKATLKIGAIFSHEETNKLSGKNELWFCYKIGKAEWMEIFALPTNKNMQPNR